MMMALHGSDATFLHRPQAAALHHRAFYLEKLMQDKAGVDVHTFAFAIGGQMASDAFFTAETMLKGARRPLEIVYGIAPRDLMDNSLKDVASTETFRYMERIGDLSDWAWSARRSSWERLEYLFGCFSFIYKHRLDFVYIQHKACQMLLCRILGLRDLESVHTHFLLRGMAMMQLPEDSGPNESLYEPFRASQAKCRDNLEQYRYRYQPFRPRIYLEQLGYLELLMRFCRAQNVRLVMVNMPLMPANLAVMPSGFYRLYLSDLHRMSTKYQAEMIDFNRTNLFSSADFMDSVHLNGLGAKKFMELLSDRLGKRQVANTTSGAVQ